MGVNAAIFESAGKRTEHYIPGVYDRSKNITSTSSVSSGNLCLLGSANGGKPLELLEFDSLVDAQTTLINGDLLDAVGYAFSGSTEYVPQKVFAVRVNKGKQSQLVLKNGDSTVLTLKAWDYGVHTNQLRMKVEKGTLLNSKKITITYKDKVFETGDIVKESIKLACSSENANVTINLNSITIVRTDENGETNTTTLMFEDFPKLSELVERINTEEDLIATIIDADENALSSSLDFVVGETLSTEEKTLYSNAFAIANELKKNEYISSVEMGNLRVPLSDMGFTYFTGGESSVASIQDWVEALSFLETEDIQIIATPSTDSAVHSMINTHCAMMCSTENRRERTFFVGGAIGISDDEAINAAKGLNTENGSYVCDNAIVNNPFTGEVETISGAMLSVMLAGMESSMAVNLPLTNKTLNVLGFTKKRTTGAINNLIKNGVLVCNPSSDNPNNNVVIRAVTTYQSGDLIKNERSMTRENYYMNRDLRKVYTSGVGGLNGANKTSSVLQVLKDKAKEWADLGYIIPSNGQNVWNITIRTDGDKTYLTYSRYLTAPSNFMFITVSNHIYTSTEVL